MVECIGLSLFKARIMYLGMSMERSRKGSCFLEEVLHTWHVTSDCSIPPKMEVTCGRRVRVEFELG